MNTEEAFTPEQVTEVVGALHNATMDKWLGAGLPLVIGAVVIQIVMQALNRLVAKLPLDKAMLSFLTAAARIVMVIVLVTMVAGQLDVPITSLVALLSLFALAVSLSVQDVLANVVSGLVVRLAKPFAAGSFISTEKAEGTVERIGLMYTHLVTPDNKTVMIPNKELSAERIVNYTEKAYRRVDAKLWLGFEIDTDMALEALMAAVEGVISAPDPPTPVPVRYPPPVEFAVASLRPLPQPRPRGRLPARRPHTGGGRPRGLRPRILLLQKKRQARTG